MPLTFNRWFNLTAGVVLFITGAAKVWSAFGTARLLGYPDPVFEISFGHLMLIVGIIELIVAGLCLSNKDIRLATILVAYISTNFFFYRAGLWIAHWQRPCLCLGFLTDALHISPQFADITVKAALIYLMTGSYFLLLAPWVTNNRTVKFE